MTQTLRERGIAVAHKYRAPKTAEVIRDERSCYEKILETACSEVGISRIVAAVDEMADPWIAKEALRLIPNLATKDRDVLLKVIVESKNINVGNALRWDDCPMLTRKQWKRLWDAFDFVERPFRTFGGH